MAEGNGQEVAWLEEFVAQIRALHERILSESGGSAGEHTTLLFASCARPFQSAFGEELFKTDFEKAAALLHGIITSHVFVDGNKRTAILAAILFLASSEQIPDAPSALQVRMLGELAVAVASSKMTVDEVADWLRRVLER